MGDLNWISQEAHKIHDWFHAVFYILVTVFLLVGVLLEYFKMPLGNVPSFGPLVGRTLIAAILLYTYPEVANILRDVTSALSTKLGDLAQFHVALDKMGDQVDKLTWSWTSVKRSVIFSMSYLAFFLLYFSVHVAQALYLYTSVLLYIFSPILIALYVLPQTSAATSGLYRSLIEVQLWKPVWCVIATIIWSTGISGIVSEGSSVSFLSAICFCLIAAGSLLLTPLVVHSLAGGGLSSMAQNISTIAVPGIGTIAPLRSMATSTEVAKRTYNTGLNSIEWLTQKHFPKASKVVSEVPRFRVIEKPPVFEKKDPDTEKSRKGKS